jgi:beta-mannosidase
MIWKLAGGKRSCRPTHISSACTLVLHLLIITYLTQHFQLAKDFPSLVYLTQVLQAEAMRIGVEHWRRHRDRCSGALYWQLNDCWPVASWSSIDYAGRWKALQYASRRFYAPVLLSIEDNGDRMNVFVTNDTPDTWQGEVRWSLETVRGETRMDGQAAIHAAPLATTPVSQLDFADRVTDENRRELILVCELWRNDQRMALTVTPLAPDKHLRLEEAQVEVQLQTAGTKLSILLRAHTLARFVELSFKDTDVVFSDNYFDLPAHASLAVTCSLPEGWTLDQSRQALRIRSLADSH